MPRFVRHPEFAEENLFTGSGSLAWRRPEPVSRATERIDGGERGEEGVGAQ